MRAVLLLTAASLVATAAGAETRTIAGSQLVFSDNLSEDTYITTDASLHGQIKLTMDGDLNCLSIVSSGATVVGTDGCSSSEGELHVAVSPDTAVTLDTRGSGDVHIEDLRAPLVLSLAGSGDVHMGRAGGLVLSVHGSNNVTAGEIAGPTSLEITGSGDVRLRAVHGPFNSRQLGSGDLVIGRINADAVNLEGSGSGDALLGAGRIGNLRARFSGSSDLAVAAEIQNADVTATGGSEIKLGRVSGTLTKASSGSSNIIVGGNGLVNTLIGQAAEKIGDIDGDGTNITVHTGSGPGIGHFLTIGFVLIALFIGYRIVRRGGGLPALRRGPQATAPTHPGVLAICERMTQLDARLSRLEGYVTTREFDLNRKFRELGK